MEIYHVFTVSNAMISNLQLFTMSAVFDDCSDRSDMRLGKEAWYRICEGGESAAIYDAAFLSFLPFVILMRHFGRDPGYVAMVEAMALVNRLLLIFYH